MTSKKRTSFLLTLPYKVAREARRFAIRRLGMPLTLNTSGVLRRGAEGVSKSVGQHSFIPPSQSVLQEHYSDSIASKMDDGFVLYRILGNDLVPRHAKGQTYKNLKFILENESAFVGCEKRFILNRIADEEELTRILDLLDQHDFAYSIIPFELDRYLETQWDQSLFPSEDYVFSPALSKRNDRSRQVVDSLMRWRKSLYGINNNGARNLALLEGRQRAKWVLPFDGNCFFTEDAFEALRRTVVHSPHYPYFIVPMARISDNAALLTSGFSPPAGEEPQISFRCDATELFDEKIPYGRRPKVNLLWRLGVPGAWDRYRCEVWDPPHPGPSDQIGWFKTAGWVARLNSGRPDLEAGKKSMHSRGVARDVSISTYLDNLDGRRYQGVYDPEEPVFYPAQALKEATRNSPNVTKALYEAAQAALHRGPYSVADKLGTAPSGDKYDYFSQAPYWWPRPASLTGRPFVRRDGEFYPGTKLFSPGSEQFDRSSFQNLCDDATSLILAGTVFDQADFKQHAALLVRTWFVNPKTAMKPNLSYAQVRLGHDDDLGTGRGLIDFRDIVRVLDCVRLLSADGFLSEQELGLFRAWLSEFANWLETDPKALTERVQSNNHGNYYDLQLAGIARYLGDDAMLARAANWAKLRLSVQVAEDGSMPSELSRTRPAHYVAFTLAAWNHLARVYDGTGADVWSWTGSRGQGLTDAYQWLSDTAKAKSLIGPEESGFDYDRLIPLWCDCRKYLPSVTDVPVFETDECRPVLDPDFSILPYWQLAR